MTRGGKERGVWMGRGEGESLFKIEHKNYAMEEKGQKCEKMNSCIQLRESKLNKLLYVPFALSWANINLISSSNLKQLFFTYNTSLKTS